MSNAPQMSTMPTHDAWQADRPEQCTGCPPGNSLPLVANEETCWQHGWWHAQNYS